MFLLKSLHQLTDYLYLVWILDMVSFFFEPCSLVGIATGYGLDGPGIESLWGRNFPHLSRTALGLIQPPAQWIPGFSQMVKSSRGVTLTPHPLLVPWTWKGRAIPLIPLWAVRPVQSLSACTRGHFTLPFLPFASNRLLPGTMIDDQILISSKRAEGKKISCFHPIHLTSGTGFATDICLVKDQNYPYLGNVLMRKRCM